MPLRAPASGYCAAVRKPLHSPTTDAAALRVFALPPPPLVSWRFSLLARRVSGPSAVDHYLPQKVPKCSAPPEPTVSVNTRNPLYCCSSVVSCCCLFFV